MSSQAAEVGRVKFGDVVRNRTDVVGDVRSHDEERTVGLDDIDPDSLTLRRFGSVDDGTTFTRRFDSGQVLFGKRRAYQRKVAVARFSGVCSGDILVFEARPEYLSPELLPFIVQSERFFQHALRTSKGSLSPRTSWRDLASYEFDLASLDEQDRMATLLWAAFDAIQARHELIIGLRELGRIFFEDQLIRLRGSVRPFSTLWTASPDSGYSMVKTEADTGHFVLTLTALSKDGYQAGCMKPVPAVPAVLKARLHRGDFLVSRSNTQDLVGLAGIFSEDRDNVSFPDTMMRISLDTTLVRKTYAEAVLLSSLGRQHMRKVAAGTSGSMRKINRTSLGSLPFPMPPLEVQDSLVTHIEQFSQAISKEREQLSRARELYRALRDGVLNTPKLPIQ